MVSAPASPACPPERFEMNCGTLSSNAPNIDDAITSISSAKNTSTAGCCSQAPNSFPESAENTPSAEYVMAMPSTYSVDSATRRPRLVPLCWLK